MTRPAAGRYGEVMVELGRMTQEELDAIQAEDPAEVDRETEETLRELDLLVEEEDLPFGSTLSWRIVARLEAGRPSPVLSTAQR